MGMFYRSGIAVLLSSGFLALLMGVGPNPSPQESPYEQCTQDAKIDQAIDGMHSEHSALLFQGGEIPLPPTLQQAPDGRVTFAWRKCQITLRPRSDLKIPLKMNSLRSRRTEFGHVALERCTEILGPNLRQMKEGGGTQRCLTFEATFPDLGIGQKIRAPQPDLPDSRIEKLACGLRVDAEALDAMAFRDFGDEIFHADTVREMQTQKVSPHWNLPVAACECLISGKPCGKASSNSVSQPSDRPSDTPTDAPTDAPAHEEEGEDSDSEDGTVPAVPAV